MSEPRKQKATRLGVAKCLFLLARPERFERPTPWFVAKYSIQLSYGRAVRVVHYREDSQECKGFFKKLAKRSNLYRSYRLFQGWIGTLEMELPGAPSMIFRLMAK